MTRNLIVENLPRPLHLVIVDDERGITAFIGFVARERGWTVEAAVDEAEFRLAYAGQKPDAIALDLQLGRSDGIEQLRFLAQDRFGGSLLLLSGMDERVLSAARERANSLGLSVAVSETKPIRVKRLHDILEKIERDFAPASVKKSAATRESGQPASVIHPADVRAALESGQTELHLQPILNARDRSVTRLEALVRWRHPIFGMIPPDRFIPIAEQDEATIDALTFWVVETALAHYMKLSRQGFAIPISVNLSRVNLHALDFPDVVAAALEKRGIPPSALSFELTESAALGDPGAVIDILTRLRLKGFALMIDDFGTGYSSLHNLRHLPFSEIKLDKSFICDVLQSRDSLTIVKSVVDMARTLNLETVAEGVESASEAQFLTALGVTALQGYHFSRPLPLDALLNWLHARTPAKAEAHGPDVSG